MIPIPQGVLAKVFSPLPPLFNEFAAFKHATLAFASRHFSAGHANVDHASEDYACEDYACEDYSCERTVGHDLG